MVEIRWPCSLSEAAGAVSVESARDVLEAASQSDAGLYSIYSELYDLKRLQIYLNYGQDYTAPIILDVKMELKNWKKGMQKPLMELIPAIGSASFAGSERPLLTIDTQ